MANYQPSQTLKLNILFHGTFAFIQEEAQISALIPHISQHSIRAGNWLGETELAGGDATYTLAGVTADPRGRFDRRRNLFLKYRKLPDSPKPYATLIFPRPASIASLRVAAAPRNLFADPTDLVGEDNDLHIATLQVFTYDIGIKSVNKLRLESAGGRGGHYWEPTFQTRPKNGATILTINLHIFSTEDHYVEPYQANDFNRCAEMIGAKVALKPEAAYQTDSIDPNEKLPDGVAPQETEELALRTQRMARLGRLVCQNGDPNQAWYEDDALDGGSPECGCNVREREGDSQ